MKRQKGYTLIELIIVLALFGILINLVFINFSVLDKFKTKQELKQLRRDILYTRNQAIVKGKAYYFELDYDENGYYILIDGQKIKIVNFESGLKLVRTPFKTVIFERTGVPSKAGTIVLKSKEGKRFEARITPVIAKVKIYEVAE